MSLTNNQINELISIARLKASYYSDLVIGVIPSGTKEAQSYPYEDFKKRLGLDDIRFHWLCSDRVYLAGGAALNWIMSENKNEDIDFFFKNEETANNFKLAIQNWNFKETRESNYAKTFFNPDEKVIVQLVGADRKYERDVKISEQNGFIPFGTPQETIERFDIEVCKFAVDSENVYFTETAILDLIQKRASSSKTKYNTSHRLIKYSRKGFYIPLTDPIPVANAESNDTY